MKFYTAPDLPTLESLAKYEIEFAKVRKEGQYKYLEFSITRDGVVIMWGEHALGSKRGLDEFADTMLNVERRRDDLLTLAEELKAGVQ